MNLPQNSFIWTVLSIALGGSSRFAVPVIGTAMVLFSTLACAQPLHPAQEATVLLINRKYDVCATGFLIDSNTLLTAYHVADALCPVGDCEGTEVFTGNGKVQQVHLVPKNLIPAYDVATLSVSPPWNQSSLRLAPIQPLKTSEVTTVGFPRCGRQKESTGRMQLSGATSKTTASVAHGSSGSPVIASDGTVVGLISEAGSVFDAILSIMAGENFSSAKVALLGNYQQYVAATLSEQFAMQVDYLLQEYKTLILPSSGLARFQYSASFLVRVRELIFQIAMTGLFSVETSLYDLPPLKQLEILQAHAGTNSELSTLLLTASFEKYGPTRNLLQQMDANYLQAIIESTPGIDKKIIGEVAQKLQQTRYVGSELGLILFCAKTFLYVLLICCLVSASLAAVFIKTPGGLIKKSITTAGVLIFIWPISLLAWWWGYHRKLKRTRPKS